MSRPAPHSRPGLGTTEERLGPTGEDAEEHQTQHRMGTGRRVAVESRARGRRDLADDARALPATGRRRPFPTPSLGCRVADPRQPPGSGQQPRAAGEGRSRGSASPAPPRGRPPVRAGSEPSSRGASVRPVRGGEGHDASSSALRQEKRNLTGIRPTTTSPPTRRQKEKARPPRRGAGLGSREGPLSPPCGYDGATTRRSSRCRRRRCRRPLHRCRPRPRRPRTRGGRRCPPRA